MIELQCMYVVLWCLVIVQKVHDILREAWDAEGSPFKGQPFDPSVVNVSPSGMWWPLLDCFLTDLFRHSGVIFVMRWILTDTFLLSNFLRNTEWAASYSFVSSCFVGQYQLYVIKYMLRHTCYIVIFDGDFGAAYNLFSIEVKVT